MDYKLLQILNDILNSNEHTLKLYCCRIFHILAKKNYVLVNIIKVLCHNLTATFRCKSINNHKQEVL